jgi:hypothetical protein
VAIVESFGGAKAMSGSENTRLVRQLSVGIIIGLILGVAIGLLIGWVLWPVEYEQAYTHQLVDEEKQQYVAAVVDSYSLTGQMDVARQRLNTWTTEEKVSELARLFAEYQAAGQAEQAKQVATLATEMQRVEGWDPEVVGKVTDQVANEYAQQGVPEKAQAVSPFAGALAASPPPAAAPSTPLPSVSQDQTPVPGGLRTLALCGLLLLIGGLVALIVIIARHRGARDEALVVAEVEPDSLDIGPAALLRKKSSYSLGMDNFDESFAIETEDDEWLGECGMGISESLPDGTPRRVTAFEVWLFDKPNTRTVTTVLLSDFADNNEALRNKLASRGDLVLATPGGAFTLETPALVVEAEILDMEYGEEMPSLGYFNKLEVLLTARRRLEPDAGSDVVRTTSP